MDLDIIVLSEEDTKTNNVFSFTGGTLKKKNLHY